MKTTTQNVFEFPPAGMACPSCGAWVWAADPTGPVLCHCGFAADAAAVREAAYLRSHLPGWTQRLAELDSALAGAGVDGPVVAAAVSSSEGATAVPRVRVSGAYAVLVTLGALLIAAGVLALTVVLWEVAGPLGQAALMATVALLVGVAAIAIRRRIPATANALAVIAVLVWLAFAVLTARELVGLELDEAGWTLALASTAALTWVAGWLSRLRPWAFTAALTTPVAVALALVMAALRVGGSLPLVAAGTALALLVVALAWRPWGLPTPERVVAGVTGSVAAYTVAASSLAVAQDPSTYAALAAGLLVVAGACVLVAPLRVMAPLLAGTAAGLTAGLGWASPWWSAALVAAVVAAAVLVRRVPWAPLGAAAAAGTWAVLAAVEYSEMEPEPWWAYVAVLAVGAVAIAVRAWLDGQAALLLASAAAGVLAVLWGMGLAVGVGDDPAVEWFTLPLAVLLLAYGLLAARMRSGQSSLITLGPALAVALWPSAVVGLANEDPARLYAVLVAGIVVLLAGLAARRAGMVAPAAVAVVLVALRPLSLLVEWMPSWILYTAAGALLLVIGARFEHVRSRAASVRHWVHDYFR